MANSRRVFLKECNREWCLMLTRKIPDIQFSSYREISTPQFEPLTDYDVAFSFSVSHITSELNQEHRFRVYLHKFHDAAISPSLNVSIETSVKNSDCFNYVLDQKIINVQEMKNEVLLGTTPKAKFVPMASLTLRCKMIFFEDTMDIRHSSNSSLDTKGDVIVIDAKSPLNIQSQTNSTVSKSAPCPTYDPNMVSPKSSLCEQCNSNTTISNMFPDFIKNLKSVYNPTALSDIKFEVEDKSFAAHKVIVAAHSPVFMKMLTCDFLESKTNSVLITDTTAESFDRFLKYLYSCEIEDKSWPALKELYYLADKYDVEILRNDCRSVAISILSIEIVCDILKVADQFDDLKIKKPSIEFAVSHIKELVHREDWIELTKTHANIAYDVTINFIPQ